MIGTQENLASSLGKTKVDVLGFSSEEELSKALIPLMQEVPELSKEMEPLSFAL